MKTCCRIVTLALAAVFSIGLCLQLSGCHGSGGLSEFVMPGYTYNEDGSFEIDPGYELTGYYEIVFLA